MKPDDVKCYLSLWSKSESEEELDRAYAIARKLGWGLKIRAMLDFGEVVADAQFNPLLTNFANDCLDFAIYEL